MSIETKHRLDQLQTGAPLSPADVEQAWERFRARRRTATVTLRARRPPWATAAMVATLGLGAALLATLGFVPAARAATAQFLSLFRIASVTAVPVDIASASPLANADTQKMLEQLFARTVTVTRNGQPQSVADADAAAQLAGFALRLPQAWRDSAGFRVQGEVRLQAVVDRAQAQEILDGAGLQGVEIPPQADGGQVDVHLAPLVVITHGDCAQWLRRTSHATYGDPPLNGTCTVMRESPSPRVSLPPGLEMQKIAEIGLQLLGMSADQAQQYCQTVDWTSTLVVPFPSQAVEARTVTVDGVDGILLTPSRSTAPARYVLLWSRQGMLYSISGPGTGDDGLQLAASLSSE